MECAIPNLKNKLLILKLNYLKNILFSIENMILHYTMEVYCTCI